ncbi:precorrin-6Y methyltransferase [Terasakiispira papahanaumokuakeensis]|uniref:Precorrin-6Y methyltransferase n=1 Tax=Terasakiispira papahanaumokuakeensis TaxID=197479 RepID=A0A1E2VC61_9GAMM|nr:bifunctional cobalt-precorrin-7 (C(5))-methyltransferase/cobalt-precorrin-6B (C(15))-methyltransferase [Terasakiispira papahanaumokuakeensis]ODC04600.1 precorrin-6Y methyltransferase [Terasakiispira papahanaumokuakeensis]
MADTQATPWLTLIGWGESGIGALSAASRAALDEAEVVFGAARHLRLLPDLKGEVRCWPVPFADGIPQLLAERGRRVVMLVSGDPFCFGAGTTITRYLAREEWHAFPAPSTFGLAAARLGWALEKTVCLGLHAAPLQRARPHMQPGQRLLILVRDGQSVGMLAQLISRWGFGRSQLHLLEALDGARERWRQGMAEYTVPPDIQAPVIVGVEVDGDGPAIPMSSGWPDHFFEHDGQLTKQPIRALTLSALAPQAGQCLWDIGAGSGAIAIEWLARHHLTQAVAFEQSSERAARARRNALALGQDRLHVVEGRAPLTLDDQPLPDTVFIGGGVSEALLNWLWTHLAEGTRVVANAVSLESEALLSHWQRHNGGELLRFDWAKAETMGPRRGWKARYPIVQWQTWR